MKWTLETVLVLGKVPHQNIEREIGCFYQGEMAAWALRDLGSAPTFSLAPSRTWVKDDWSIGTFISGYRQDKFNNFQV